MKYVKVRFPNSAREFTYSCEDDTVQPTDEVQITTIAALRIVLRTIGTKHAPAPGDK